MNRYLEKFTFQQLLELFISTTKEFINALKYERPSKELNHLRNQIKSISEVIEHKKNDLKKAC